MATATAQTSEKSHSGTGSIYISNSFSDVYTALSIPKYSIINSAKWYFYVKETTNKLGKADLYLFFGSDLGSSVYQLYYGNGVIPKNNGNYLETIIDLKNYMSSNSANAGTISYSGATSIQSRFQSSLLSRTYKTYYKIICDYTAPKFVVELTAGAGGTVTGQGTYNFGTTFTIKAIPNSGYKFVKWSDGNTSETRTFTVNNSLITAHETHKTYTAEFEPDKINNILIDTVKPKKILIDNQEVKAIFVDTTKVYG